MTFNIPRKTNTQPIQIHNMPPGPVVLTLTNWLEQHLGALVEATNKEDFDTAFNAFIAPHANVTVNGKKITVQEYKEGIWTEQRREQSASLSFKGIVEVPKDPKAIVQVCTFACSCSHCC